MNSDVSGAYPDVNARKPKSGSEAKVTLLKVSKNPSAQAASSRHAWTVEFQIDWNTMTSVVNIAVTPTIADEADIIRVARARLAAFAKDLQAQTEGWAEPAPQSA